MSFKSSSKKLCVPIESRLISVLAKSFRKFLSKSSGLASSAICEAQTDFVSRALLVKLKDGSEEHIDWLETQHELIEQMGIEKYTQSLLED